MASASNVAMIVDNVAHFEVGNDERCVRLRYRVRNE